MSPTGKTVVAGAARTLLPIFLAAALASPSLQAQSHPEPNDARKAAGNSTGPGALPEAGSHALGGKAARGLARCYICVPHFSEDDCLWVMFPPPCPPPETEVRGWVHGDYSTDAEPLSPTGVPAPPVLGRKPQAAALDAAPVPQKPAHRIDRTFWLMAALHGAAVAADIATTANRCSGCTEANPLLGRHPSVGRLVGIEVPLYVLSVWADRIVRKDFKGRWWLIVPAAGAAIHGAAAVHNAFLH